MSEQTRFGTIEQTHAELALRDLSNPEVREQIRIKAVEDARKSIQRIRRRQ